MPQNVREWNIIIAYTFIKDNILLAFGSEIEFVF